MSGKEIKASKSVKDALEGTGIKLEDIPQSKAGTVTMKDFEAHLKAVKKSDKEGTPAPDASTPDTPADAPAPDADAPQEPAPDAPKEPPAKKTAAPKETVEAESEAEKERKLICVLEIRESHITYKAGAVYKGKNTEHLLKRKAIKWA